MRVREGKEIAEVLASCVRLVRLRRGVCAFLRFTGGAGMISSLTLILCRLLLSKEMQSGPWILGSLSVGLIAGLLSCLMGVDRHKAALILDISLGLKERLSTGLELLESGSGSSVALLQLRDAVTIARERGKDLKQIFE